MLLSCLLPLLLWSPSVTATPGTHQKRLLRTERTSKGRCVAQIPYDLLYSDQVLETRAVKSALNQIQRQLRANYSSSPDALSLSILHGSRPEPLLTYSHGKLHLNESTPSSDAALADTVDTHSIFRTNSISKLFTSTSLLVLQKQARDAKRPRIGFDTLLSEALPEFSLPEHDWENGGSDITLDMLASHTSGLPREGSSSGFHLTGTGSTGMASGPFLGRSWSTPTEASVLEFVKRTGLVWAPGQRPVYSNLGYNLLGFAVAKMASVLHGTAYTSSAYIDKMILQPLNLSRSFYGKIPEELRGNVVFPYGASTVDAVIGEGYNPSVGLFSTVADICSFVHATLLSPNPALITMPQRRMWMTNKFSIYDSKQAVGPGWEVDLLPSDASTFSAPPGSPRAIGPEIELVYGKDGDGGGQHSSITILPDLGYGIVAFSAEGPPASDSSAPPSYPHPLSLLLHLTLARAFRSGYAELMQQGLVGAFARLGNATSGASYQQSGARLALDSTGSLRLFNLTWNGVSALERIDALNWVANATTGPTYFDNPRGLQLHPSYSQPGQWHMAVDPDNECDWGDFDGYTDVNGVPMDQVFLSMNGTLRYEPLGASFVRLS